MVSSRRLVLAIVLVAIVVLSAAIPASAQGCVPDDPWCFPAGQACSFNLQVVFSTSSQVTRAFFDRDANLVRIISAGKGSDITFTNLETGTTLTTRANGAVMYATPNGDGSYTVALMGHNIVFLFPTDHPAGPSTTLYVGRIQYRLDEPGTANIFTMQETSGTKIDICAALSN